MMLLVHRRLGVLVALLACWGLVVPSGSLHAANAWDDFVVAGQVRRLADDRPVVDAPVRLHWQVPIMCGTGWWMGAHVVDGRTDAQGRFRFALDARVGPWAVSVLPSAEAGMVGLGMPGIPPNPSPGDREDLLLQPGPGGTVEGIVRDGQGRPVPGALVEMTAGFAGVVAATRSDASGRFGFVHAPESFGLATSSETGRGLYGVSAGVTPGGTVRGVELVLQPARHVRGMVQDADGRPATDLQVTLTHTSSPVGEDGFKRRLVIDERVVTDAQGRFAFTDLPAVTLQVSVDDRSHLPWSRTLLPGDDDVEVRLDRGGLVRGLVCDDEGRPLEGATVRAPRVLPRVTDAQGHFEMSGLDPDLTHVLHVLADGHALQVRTLAFDHGPVAETVFVLPHGHSISGRVLDTAGRAVRRHRVTLRGERTIGSGYRWSWEHLAGIDRMDTDADGHFRFDGLNPGLYQLQFTDDLGRVSVTVPAGVMDASLRFRPIHLDPRLVLMGRVTDVRTGESVSAFQVAPYHNVSGPSPHRFDVENRFGLFLSEPLPARIEFVDILADGYVPQRLLLDDGEGGVVRLDVRLEPEARVRLRFVDEHGEPVPRARFLVRGSQGLIPQVASGGWLTWGYTYADDRGRAALRGLPRERVTIMALDPRRHVGEGVISAPLDLRLGAPAERIKVVLAGS